MKKQTPLTVPKYSKNEKLRRWGIANRIMEEEELDALIIYGDREASFPASFAPDSYFTNERPGTIVIFPRHGEPISIVPLITAVEDHIQESHTHTKGWIRPENMYVGKMGANVVEIMEDRGLNKGTVGIIGLEPYPPFYFDGAIPFNTWQYLLEDLSNVTFKTVDTKFKEYTSVKSDEEIAVLKWSADVGEKMCDAMLNATHPGVRENEIYAAAIATAALNVGYTTELLMGSGPEFVGWGPPTWTFRPEEPRTVNEGDIVLAEVFNSFGMLETQHQPAIAVGKVHSDYERLADAARDSYEMGVAALTEGTSFGEVVEAMRKPMRKIKDSWHVHPLVHSMNPFGLIGAGEGWPKLPEIKNYGKVLPIPDVGLDTMLKKGMVFAFEPNCAVGNRLMNLGGTVIVGDQKGIELNHNTTHLMHA